MKHHSLLLIVLTLIIIPMTGASQSTFEGYLSILVRIIDNGSPLPQFKFVVKESGLEGAVKNTSLTKEGKSFLEHCCTDDSGYSLVHLWSFGSSDNVSGATQEVIGKIAFTFTNGVEITTDIAKTLEVSQVAIDKESVLMVIIDIAEFKKVKPTYQPAVEKENPFTRSPVK